MTEKDSSSTGFHTQSLHEGHVVDSDTGSRAVPIYQTTAYLFKDQDHASRLFNLEEFGNIYTRLQNPTTDVLEKRIAALEKGKAGLALSSGQAASFTGMLTLLKAGDEIVASNALYGGTFTLLKLTLKRMGIHTHFVDIQDLNQVEKAITPATRLLFYETLPNPDLRVPPMKELAEIAHSKHIPVMVDNTVATPYLCNPIQHGADMVVHSATKFMGGHGTSMGGILIDAGSFPWNNGMFPEFTEPHPGYHGLQFYQAFQELAYIIKARVDILRDIGCCISPFNAFQILQGIETLPLRMKKHCENALTLAEFLDQHNKVAWLRYPGTHGLKKNQIEDAPHTESYLQNGYGALLTFGLKEGFSACKELINKVRLFSFLANIGDAKSLIIHPASSTHQQLTAEEQLASGVPPDLIRLSIGLEDAEDLIKDLDQAL